MKKNICLNCGSIFSSESHRFPVCKCGNTESVSLTSPYGIIEPEGIKLFNLGKKTHIDFLEINTLAKAIVNLPIVKGNDFKKKVLSEIENDEKNIERINEMQPWEIISHNCHYRNSGIYKKLFDNGYNNVCKAIRVNGVILHHPIDDDGRKRHIDYDVLYKVTKDLSDFRVYLAFEYVLYGYKDIDLINTLAKNGVNIDGFCSLLNKTDWSYGKIERYIKEYGAISCFGDEIVDKLQRFNYISNSLYNNCGKTFDESNPVYLNTFLAENYYRIGIRNGDIAIGKIKNNYLNDDAIYSINKRCGLKTIRQATLQESTSDEVRLHIPLFGNIKSVYVIELNGEVETYILVDDKSEAIMFGDCSDENKIKVNEYFDNIDNCSKNMKVI